METKKQYEAFSTLLLDAYGRWFFDELAKGRKPYDIKESEWCRLFSYKLATWGKWRNGNTLPDQSNLAKMAANPYIGPAVYDTLPARVPDPDKEEAEFQDFINDFYSLDRDTQRAIMRIWRKRKKHTIAIA